MVREALLELPLKSTTCGQFMMMLLTPLLTPLSAQHPGTAGNREQGNQLI
jgi:hypothetical protein